jgi:serine/threonine-protein kinase RsbW
MRPTAPQDGPGGPVATVPFRVDVRVAGGVAAFDAGRVALSAHLASRGVEPRARHGCELVFEELVINVLRHGGLGESDATACIGVETVVGDDEVVMQFDAPGVAFDPSSALLPKPPESIEDAPIGGLGLVLVRRTARRIEYRRVGGRNLTTVAIARA